MYLIHENKSNQIILNSEREETNGCSKIIKGREDEEEEEVCKRYTTGAADSSTAGLPHPPSPSPLVTTKFLFNASKKKRIVKVAKREYQKS